MDVSADQLCGEKVGVLGGTFDPVHFGHLAVADNALVKLHLDQIIFIPAARPPHKPDHKISSFVHRATMLDLAVKDRPEFVVSKMEEQRSGPSYSIDTLKELHSRFVKKSTLYFLIGVDAFLEIDTWKDFRSLPELCDIVVIDRPLFPFETMEEKMRKLGSYEYSSEERCWLSPVVKGRIHTLSIDPVDISSTEIREKRALGQLIDSSVPYDVANYIEKRGLYT